MNRPPKSVTRRDLLKQTVRALPVLFSIPLLSCTATHETSDPPDPNALQFAGGAISYSITGDELPVEPQAIIDWITTAARAVTTYFGHYPVKRVNIAITIGGEGRISSGVTYSGRRIEIRLGHSTSPRDLQRDWMMTHEMFHLGFPTLDDQYMWMGEGLSTYLEPLARARIGNMTAQQVWSQFARNMPKGLPEPGDQGLNQTHTWGRTYWGGALFWLLADVDIREKTGNQRSLDTAIRAILEAGGTGASHWPIERVLESANRATGTNILSHLYETHATISTAPDLSDLWHRLGVKSTLGRATFDDTAPLAMVRLSMTQDTRN